MNAQTQAQTNLDLLDATLDDLNDLPEFKLFPNGAHRVTISWEEKEVNDNPCVELKLKNLETVELSDPTDTPMEPGTEGTVLYQLNNEFGVGNLKAVLKPLSEHFEISKVRDIIEASTGAECLVVTKLRKDKKDPDRKYLGITSIEVV